MRGVITEASAVGPGAIGTLDPMPDRHLGADRASCVEPAGLAAKAERSRLMHDRLREARHQERQARDATTIWLPACPEAPADFVARPAMLTYGNLGWVLVHLPDLHEWYETSREVALAVSTRVRMLAYLARGPDGAEDGEA